MKRAGKPPETCPHCGADVPPHARACPECGSDEATGWSEQARVDSLDLPDQGFDYDDFVQREFEVPGRPRMRNRSWLLITAFVLVAAFLAWLLRR